MLVPNLKVHSTFFFKLNVWALYILFQECDNGKHWVDAMEQLQHLLFLFIIPRAGCRSFVVQPLCNITCDQTLKLEKNLYWVRQILQFIPILVPLILAKCWIENFTFFSLSICSCMENEVYFYFSFHAHAWVLDHWACYI